jgi:EAL domain-containing protein (putative c-di-GMP-specific phosphodiesterase class I)
LIKKATTIEFTQGETIFNKDDMGSCAYLIESGEVEVLNGGKALAILGPGEIFGEMAIIDGSTRAATARAMSRCTLLEVSKTQLNERIEDSDTVVKFLISVLLTRLRDTLSDSGEVSDHTKPNKNKNNKVINLNDYKSNKDVVEKIKLESELKEALDSGQFAMNYQPILDFKTGNISGFEALMRWNSPKRGFVRPDIFIGVAEETSLIIPMGHWIIKQSVKDFASIKKQLIADDKYKKPMFMSINVAAKQFNDKKLFKVLNKAIEKYGIEPREVKLEITERVLLAGDFVFEWIINARKKGFSVALDDFGTGFSSLSYLANLEVNNLKIDKSFVEKMIEDPKTKSIVKSVVDLSKSLGLTVIAEGVETQAEWDILENLGCDFMQGYLFSKPLSLDATIELLSDKSGVVKKVA